MKKKTKDYKAVLVLVCIALLAGLLFVPVNEHYGEDYKYHIRYIKLYEKAVNFLSRHFMYKDIADGIAEGEEDGDRVVMGVLRWVSDNIYGGIPEGLKIKDDHVANVIIRGYGTDDQLADVFCTLCIYRGIKASMYRAASSEGSLRIMAVVKTGGGWILVDPYEGRVFRDAQGELAGPVEISESPDDVRMFSVETDTEVKDEGYMKYLRHLKPVEEPDTVRAQLQQPLSRLVYEFKKLLGLSRKPRLFLG